MIPDFINDPSHWGHFLFWSGFKVVMAFALIMPMVAYSVMLERRVSAAIQDRIGPNRVGPFGILQPMADGLKAILKDCLLYTSPSPRDQRGSRMPSSA